MMNYDLFTFLADVVTKVFHHHSSVWFLLKVFQVSLLPLKLLAISLAIISHKLDGK